jgi:IclR family KDG regulon transcriptional repressor
MHICSLTVHGMISTKKQIWQVLMTDQNGYNVRAVERALQILNCFDDEHPERGISEISEVIGLHKATIHRILATMLSMGFVERSADGQKYRLGLQMIDLGFKVLRRMDLRRESLPFMSKFIEDWDEAIDLSVFQEKEVLYVEVMQSHHTLTIAASVGQRLPAYCTASGKLFLAYGSEKDLEVILGGTPRKYTLLTKNTREKLLPELDQIRERGYSLDQGEYEEGIKAVAAPIRNYTGVVIAAISVPGPASRISDERTHEIARVLCEYARNISRRLGWNGS